MVQVNGNEVKKIYVNRKFKKLKLQATVSSFLLLISNAVFLLPIFLENFSYAMFLLLCFLFVVKILYVDYEFCVRIAEEINKILKRKRYGNFILNRDIDDSEEILDLIKKGEEVIMCLPLGVRVHRKGENKFVPYYRVNLNHLLKEEKTS